MTNRLPTALLCLAALAVAAPAAAANWQLFATASATKVSFDRDSVRVADGYVRYRVRLEYGAPRTSRDRKHRYSSSVSELAGDCEGRTTAATSITLYDEAGKAISDTGRTPEAWRKAQASVGTDGLQARLLNHACALARGEDPAPPVMRSASVMIGAGTVVSADGLVLTNHHVAQNCESLTVLDAQRARTAATVVGTDVANDLALLKAKRSFPAAATFRRATALQAGESVTVVGFPLASVLGFEPNVTFGYVSATGGLRGDATRFQISAPIHKGNSGGPILDQGGQLIGIVTAKLDALAVQKRTGDLPQNISFGVRSEVAQAFLERHSATVNSADGGAKLENTEVARIGREITVLVACRKSAPAATQGAPGSK
ncbi:MAG TPA: serine protease [Burkholderiales bacterium]